MMAAVRALALVVAVSWLGWCRCAGASTAPASPVKLEIVAKGLEQPVALTFAPGDPAKRLFIAEKTGRIRILRAGVAVETPVLDLTAVVSNGGEQGLLGLAFHPKFAVSRRFYVNYTDRGGDTRIVEYAMSKEAPDRAEPASARELLKIAQPHANHNGGHLLFGRDGALYVGTGDGGSANDPQGHAQDDASLLGKMLRLDVDAPEPVPRVVAKGLRNPWRYSFDRATNDLYIADVGQSRWEWVHFVRGGRLEGQNFGWNIMEGRHCLRPGCDTKGRLVPVAEYSHDEGCAITGGFVYRGKAIPAIAGHYFHADFCSGLLRSFRMAESGVVDEQDWKERLDPDGRVRQVSTFGEDEAGELYLVSLDGTIRRFAPR